MVSGSFTKDKEALASGRASKIEAKDARLTMTMTTTMLAEAADE